MPSLTHYSDKPIGNLYAVEQPIRSEAMKPKGLWYSVDGGWEEWCASEMAEWIQGKLVYAVRLGRENLLRITSVEELDSFHEFYRQPLYPRARSYGIDWQMVAGVYDGIEIAPYQWPRRLEPGFLWYYGWDCASGCIWRPKGARVELLRDERLAEVAANVG